jgi:predicted metalloprotease with PDZ domain
MRKIFFTLSFLLLFIEISYTQTVQNDTYQYFVNLNNVTDDQLQIDLITPKFSEEKVTFNFPAMVPGTYKVYNFGRYVNDLKAYDNSGSELPVNRINSDSWEISGAENLYKIVYRINDTFGDTSGVSVFEPAGTSIEKDSVFVVNNHGFFGYFTDYINNDYTLSFTKPEGFYGSTSLTAVSRTNTEEVFSAPDYQFIVDNPVMFCIPDTTSISFDETKVLISVYSPGKGMTSKLIGNKLNGILNAIRNFLGGKLTADRYTFIYYFTDKEGSGGFGALEHNYSSLYYMPDVPAEASSYMINQLMSTSAHEFYHTVTPLNLHSDEIGNFDFNNPKMSEHLWLYEGVTEYNADYIQLREGLKDLKSYCKDIERKMSSASNYNDTLPFTVMSKGALDEYEAQYQNVYEKGALIGLCLDVIIRDNSNGSMGLQDVINKLVLKYGKDKSFNDDELFGEITSMTSPETGIFFEKYVAGPEKIPYNEILSRVGISVKGIPYEKIDLGHGFQIGFNQSTYRLKVNNTGVEKNKFVSDLGIKEGDELVSINGKQINFFTMKESFGSVKNQIKKGDSFEIVVARYDDSGKEKFETLKATISDTKTTFENQLSISENLTEKQKTIKSSWLGK